MAFLEINPLYRALMEQHALTTPEHFLDLPAEIISGHPDRHVGRAVLGTGPSRLGAFLKREHRIAWKDRLLNALSGFGLVSKSYREALLLRALGRAGMGCPEWIAVGEDCRGRAFLLVQECSDAKDLRLFLRQQSGASPEERYRFLRRLGVALARLHNAGFDHPDLHSKHVLVDAGGQTIRFLDWQRSRRRSFVGRGQRCFSLAALSATLADDLVTARERLLCLRTYLRHCESCRPQWSLREAVSRVLRFEKHFLRQRRIREQRRPPLTHGTQTLIWKDGEALCLTAEFHRALNGKILDSLLLANLPAQPKNVKLRMFVDLPEGQVGLLIRRRCKAGLRQLWAGFRRRPLSTPELRQASVLFRLQRCGIRTPRLLAFGQRQTPRGAIESFLLTEPISDSVPLSEWLASALIDSTERLRVIQQVGVLFKQMHEAHCYLAGIPNLAAEDAPADPLAVQCSGDGIPRVVLANLDGVLARRRGTHALAVRDWAWLCSQISSDCPSPTVQPGILP